MHKGNGESGPVKSSTEEAVDWYVHNELGTAFNAETLMLWDDWAGNPDNRQEYAEIAEIRQQAPRRLEPPKEATPGELLADLESDSDES